MGSEGILDTWCELELRDLRHSAILSRQVVLEQELKMASTLGVDSVVRAAVLKGASEEK